MGIKNLFMRVTRKDIKPITWIDTKYKPSHKLFPQWFTAKIMLQDFVTRTTDWIIDKEETQIRIGLGFPWIHNELFHETISMFILFPPEDRSSVIEICYSLMNDYLPNMDCYLGSMVTDQLIYTIRSDISNREHLIISNGGRSVLEELKFRLGIQYSPVELSYEV